MVSPWARRTETGWVLAVRVQAGAGRSAIVGTIGEALKVRISAPANEGKANAELLRFLADMLSVRTSSVTLLQGQRSRDKLVAVNGDADLSSLTRSLRRRS